MGGLASGGCDRPVRKRRRLHAGLAGTESPRRPSPRPTVRTGPTPALLPDDPAPPVRGTTPDARHSNTLPAPTTHRPEPSVRHPTAAPRRCRTSASAAGARHSTAARSRKTRCAPPSGGHPRRPHRHPSFHLPRTGPNISPPPGMRRGPIFARYSPNVLPSDK